MLNPLEGLLEVYGDMVKVYKASLGGYLHRKKKRATWTEGFHDELNGHVSDLERDGFHQVVPCS